MGVELVVISIYMICAVLFILSLSGLGQQENAKRGNYYGILAMVLAIAATFFVHEFHFNFVMFLPVFIIGGTIGLVLALRVDMINMPQLVAALHSFVGLAAVLVSYAKFLLEGHGNTLEVIEIFLGVFIGAFTFTGSLVAWGKLQEVIRPTPLIILGWGRHVINLVCLMTCIPLGVMFAREADLGLYYLLGMTTIALFLGWHLVMAIGGADMPVVVSMLNSYSGWATSASGFLLNNHLLIITGALVGASGAILSYIMCKAMNRSFLSVILGGFGQGTSSAQNTTAAVGETKEINVDHLTEELLLAKRVIIVPGYGMAVSKCQRDVGVLANLLRKRGAQVRFCIHPVAGRLPGHMNVLLAEANVPYDLVEEMSEINDDFPKTDIVLVIGANDIVNPDAQDNPTSPIAGMPVCEVWKSKRVVVFKRGRGTGYAGVENPLFYKEVTRMYYGSAEKSLKDILNRITATMDQPIENSPTEATSLVEKKEQDIAEDQIPAPVMSLGVPREITRGESRVAVPPSLVKKFRKLGFKVLVETGAGRSADFFDQAYTAKGAEIVDNEAVWRCDVVLKVRPPQSEEVTKLGSVKCLVSYFSPVDHSQLLAQLAERYPQLTVVAMDCVPRITRAQKLDSLSSMANIAGYRAVVEAFNLYKKSPRAQVTAAGKLPPANVFIIGAGVAGLAAIGYCKSLGCVVKAFDVRVAAREQAESMGAEFLEVQVQEDGSGKGGYAKEMSAQFAEAQRKMTRDTCRVADIVITTALIPGRPAPKLLYEDAVRAMKPGSVVVDMAAERGGNCTLTVPDSVIVDEVSGVQIVGYTDLASRMAPQSSELYGNNLWYLMEEMGGASNFKVDRDTNEIIHEMAILTSGKVTWVPIDQRYPPASAPVTAPAISSKQSQPQSLPSVSESPENVSRYSWQCCWQSTGWIVGIVALGGLFIAIALLTYTAFVQMFFSFILAIFIGYMVIWNVAPALHTPLMSVTNAISGIIVIGAMLTITPNSGLIDEGSAVGLAAVFFASINVVGGFVVTHRMLDMFHKEKL
jgi:NAD(P) transhydrogenase